MEVLSRKISQQQKLGLIRGLKVHRRAPEISHLLFADDALFFLKGTLENAWNLQRILSSFCAMSSEMVNNNKSYSVFSRNTPQKFRRLLNKRLKVESKERLGTYLGCPMDVTGHSIQAFQELPQKISNTITSWSFSSLNQAETSSNK